MTEPAPHLLNAARALERILSARDPAHVFSVSIGSKETTGTTAGRSGGPWLTKKELAGELRVSTRTIERLRLPHLQVGGQNRYLMSEVEAALAGGGKRGPR